MALSLGGPAISHLIDELTDLQLASVTSVCCAALVARLANASDPELQRMRTRFAADLFDLIPKQGAEHAH